MDQSNNQDVIDLIKPLLEKYRNIIDNQLNPFLSIEKIAGSIASHYEGIIECIPGNVYWLDRNGTAVGCNKNVLSMFGFKSLAQFKGLTFEKMGEFGGWTKKATQSFEKDTLEVVRTGKAKLNIEEPPIPHSDGRIIHFLSSRVPLFDHSGDIVGIIGNSVDINSLRKIAEREIEITKEKKALSLLSQREMDCVHWYLKGKNSGEIAIILGISRRTVETHIENAKSKLDCTNLFQLGYRIAEMKYTAIEFIPAS